MIISMLLSKHCANSLNERFVEYISNVERVHILDKAKEQAIEYGAFQKKNLYINDILGARK